MLKTQLLQWLIDVGVSDIVSETSDNIIEEKEIIPQLNISTLVELRQVVANVDIPMKDCAINMVFGTGNENADILLLGEAPGAEEDKQGLPFVGQSGQLLDKVLESVGLDRTKVYITNILPWRPPGNRTPTNDEILLFRPYVLKHIELINPKIVVCLGGTAAKALLQTTEGIMKLRGRWLTVDGINAKVFATFHPAYLLRSPGQKREAWRDFLTITSEATR